MAISVKHYSSRMIIFSRIAVLNSQVRHYKSTTILCAKGGKGKKKDSDDDDAKDTVVTLPKTKDLVEPMEKRLVYLKEEFSRIRAGRATPDMFNGIVVQGPNFKSPLQAIAQVAVNAPNKVTINPYDPSLSSLISNAIRESGMNLTPEGEGSSITITIPKPSAQARNELVKLASKAAEKTKTEIRNIRKEGLDKLKAIKSSISEDDTRRLTKEVKLFDQ